MQGPPPTSGPPSLWPALKELTVQQGDAPSRAEAALGNPRAQGPASRQGVLVRWSREQALSSHLRPL